MKPIEVKSILLSKQVIPTVPDIDRANKSFGDYLSQMNEESNIWLEYSESANAILNKYYVNSLIDAGAKIVSGVTCSATGQRVSNGEITYGRDYRVGSTNYGNNIYKTDRSGTSNQGKITGPGRMGGLGGWSSDGDLIVAALVSFAHNFVVMMIAFFERAKLPLNNSITLPNMILAETKEPTQFVPPLSMTYNLPPTPIMTTTMRISSPVASSFFFVQKNQNKEIFAKSDIITIEPGTSDIAVTTQLMPFENNGIIDIEPYDAPKGLVIESVSTIPPAMNF